MAKERGKGGGDVVGVAVNWDWSVGLLEASASVFHPDTIELEMIWNNAVIQRV